ncbi:class II aldolase/adducin family protein [Nocardioides sp. GY 10127]|uniref:class II aldolase/adducin family protein n=1 Tax=Nocardioides sp. GY 10127 TaxID=2569762 RepID=UPI0010A79693|nr:class II aldolase/adducin family protein [Nocardioides sp. GY 10127]TIC79132.1 hypothetical protein E8D37_18410 [Nocardioides sp. GY 10127]
MRHLQQRIELAAGLRWAARLGMQEGVDNHFTLAVPDDSGEMSGEHFLANPLGLHWSEITASSLILTDSAGTILEGEGEVEATAFHIHAPLHLRHPEQPAVFHTHMPHMTAIAAIEGGRLEMCQQNAFMFWENIVYDEQYNGLALEPAEGARIAEAATGVSAVILAGHGGVTLGSTVSEAFGYMYYLEQACRTQMLAQATGLPLRQFTAEQCAAFVSQWKTALPETAELYFQYALRTLHREEPEFAS